MLPPCRKLREALISHGPLLLSQAHPSAVARFISVGSTTAEQLGLRMPIKRLQDVKVTESSKMAPEDPGPGSPQSGLSSCVEKGSVG